MIKLVQVPDVVGLLPGAGVEYEVPEALIGTVAIVGVSVSIASVVVGAVDVVLAITDKMGNVKGRYAPLNPAAHAAQMEYTWGGTGQPYQVTVGGSDLHSVPMQRVLVQGGDRILLFGVTDPTGGSFNFNIWLDIEDG